MSLTINLKLQLTRITKNITLKYNTFEKATFDEYLIASLAKHAGSEAEAFDYIDDITGDGSLNKHYKALYAEISRFDGALLDKIMSSSLYPREVIDCSNSYQYYPEPNVSVFRNKTFSGDLGSYPDLATSVLYRNEEITELKIDDKKTDDTPGNYAVSIAPDGRISVRIADKDVDIDEELFDRIAIKEKLSLSSYDGKIFQKPSGSGWHVMYASAYKNLFSNTTYFYFDGKHCAIRKDGVLCTEIAEISGLYIYRESEIGYFGNAELCAKALEHIGKHKLFDRVKGATLTNILKSADGRVAVEFLNANLSRIIDSRTAQLAMGFVKSSNGYMLKPDALQLLVAYCDKSDYTELYKLNDGLHFTLEQLLFIDRNILSEKHAAQVDKHYADIAEMKAEIKRIIADVVTSGARERSRVLPNDSEVKRFRKLCCELQGHEARDIEKASDEQIVKWHGSALELDELLPKIKRKLDSLK